MAKPLKATKETKHTISSGNKTNHKNEVADVTKIVNSNENLLQEEKRKKALEEREVKMSEVSGQFLNASESGDDAIPQTVVVRIPNSAEKPKRSRSQN